MIAGLIVLSGLKTPVARCSLSNFGIETYLRSVHYFDSVSHKPDFFFGLGNGIDF